MNAQRQKAPVDMTVEVKLIIRERILSMRIAFLLNLLVWFSTTHPVCCCSLGSLALSASHCSEQSQSCLRMHSP